MKVPDQKSFHYSQLTFQWWSPATSLVPSLSYPEIYAHARTHTHMPHTHTHTHTCTTHTHAGNINMLLKAQEGLVKAAISESADPLPMILQLPPSASGDSNSEEVQQCTHMAEKMYPMYVLPVILLVIVRLGYIGRRTPFSSSPSLSSL